MSVYFPQAAVSLRVLWEDFGNTGDKSLKVPYKLQVLPKRMTVNINDYNTADTFEVEIDYKSFPFDPRTMRAVGISIFIEDMEKLYDADGNRVEIQPGQDNVLFQGFADEESITFDDENRVVKLEGRDFTGILIDAKYLAVKPLDLGVPFETLLKKMMAELPAAKDIVVENRTGQTLPAPKQYAPDFGAPLAGQRNTNRDDTYWEIIQDLAARLGVIVYIEIDKLVISTPRVLYDKAKSKQFIYGRNIKNLEFKRKLGRHKGFNVVVRCLSTVKEKGVLTVKIPEESTAAWRKATNTPSGPVMIPVMRPDGTADTPKAAPALAFRVRSVETRDQLVKCGEKIFEELSRQQLEGSFETKEMETIDKSKETFDLTKLRVGMPVSVEVDSTDLYQVSRFGTQQAREQYLVSVGYPRNFAATFAKTLGKFTPVFYTKAATFTLDDSGFKLKVDFLNFIDLDNSGVGLG